MQFPLAVQPQIEGPFSKGDKAENSYQSPLCDIPLFSQRELWAVINRRERKKERGGPDTTEAAIRATVISSMHYSTTL